MSFRWPTRALSFVAMCVLIMTLPLGTAAQQIAPPDASRLAPGYSVDPNGCVVGPNSAAVPPVLPPDDPAVRVSYQGNPGAQARSRAQYAEYRHDLLNAIALRRRELQSSTDDEAMKCKKMQRSVCRSASTSHVSAISWPHVTSGVVSWHDAPLETTPPLMRSRSIDTMRAYRS